MPNRIIKESICWSDTVDKLSFAAECLFTRLITVCDDFGRFDARPQMIRARCFPLRSHITEAEIVKWMAEIFEAPLIEYYEVKGILYAQFLTWDSHQRVRNKRSRIPLPEVKQEVAATCGDLRQTAEISGLNPNPYPNPYPDPESKEPTGDKSPFECCITFSDYLNLSEVYNDKIAFLVTAFKKLHSSAPDIDLEKCGGRLAGMYGKKGKDTGYILKVIWDTASQSIAGSHLDYIDAVLFKNGSKPKLQKDDPDKYVKGKYGHLVIR